VIFGRTFHPIKAREGLLVVETRQAAFGPKNQSSLAFSRNLPLIGSNFAIMHVPHNPPSEIDYLDGEARKWHPTRKFNAPGSLNEEVAEKKDRGHCGKCRERLLRISRHFHPPMIHPVSMTGF